MAKKTKYYVVWNGFAPGIYDNWDECQAQVENYPNARFKSYPDLDSATAAFRGDGTSEMKLFRAMARRNSKPDEPDGRAMVVNYEAFPEIRTDAIAVDGACAGVPGPVEYRGVRVSDGVELFRVGPMAGGTNNIGEYLAIVHAAALLARQGDTTTPIYSDSVTALAWIRGGHHRSTIASTPENVRVRELLARADAWLAAHRIPNPIIKWKTSEWGEIPADFGRK